MAAVLANDIVFFNKFSPRSRPEINKTRCFGAIKCLKANEEVEKSKKYSVVKNGNDSLELCKVVNGMWQKRGGWGNIEAEKAIESMLGYVDAGLTTFDTADTYGLAEELYGSFINRVRHERPLELLEEIKGWDYSNSGYLNALKHLTDLKEEGKIKTLGLTNFDTECLQIILENGILIVSNQVQHSVIDMHPQQKITDFVNVLELSLTLKVNMLEESTVREIAQPTFFVSASNVLTKGDLGVHSMTLRTEIGSYTEHHPSSTPTPSNAIIGSSTVERQAVQLLSQKLEVVAKGHLGVQKICHGRKVIDGEEVVWVEDVLHPNEPLFDAPQNGHYTLSELVDGGFVV